MTPSEVLSLMKEHEVEMVDFKFCDLFGQWQHMTVPASSVDESLLTDGLGFDGSSIRGWVGIHESDMILVPDLTTAVIDPIYDTPTLSLICNVYDPITRERFTRDPRNVAEKAVLYLRSTGIGDQAYFGSEAEFFVFDQVQYDVGAHYSFYQVESDEGIWNTGNDETINLGYKIPHKRGYAPVPPHDSMVELRNAIVSAMAQIGLKTECHHHEVATAGQMEIDFRFGPLVKAADSVMWFKYLVKNIARRHGKVATFMPKPIYGDNGSGMHTHQSIWKGDQPLFAGDEYGGLSKLAMHYIAGLIAHGPALAAFVAPTSNSYRRLVPGFEAPVRLAYSRRNRSAAIRIPMYSPSPASKRLEFRPPDPTCNPYLAFAAMLMAGLDGIERRLDPGAPMDKDIYALPPEELKDIPSLPGSLKDALDALERDHAFLLKGDVFTPDVIETWIRWKYQHEVEPLMLYPHPYEFLITFDA